MRVTASIVILAWRNAEHLPACLRSLAQHIALDTSHEIIIVLNGATPEVARIATSAPGVRVVRSDRNLGFAGGCNLGAAAARGEYLVFLNDDTVVEPRWLEALLDTAAAHPEAAAVGSQILYPDGSLQEAGSVVFADGSSTAIGRLRDVPASAFDFVRRVDYCSACSLLVRRDVWNEIGGFHEEYFPAYYEDTDFCLSAISRGYSVLYDPRSRVRHVESASSTADGKVFLLLRSREEFLRRWRDALDDFEPAQPLCPAAVSRAIWRARGMPPRVLFIDDRLAPSSLGSGLGRLRLALAAIARHHAVTFVATDAAFDVDREFLRAHGIGLVEEDLDRYLARPEVQFDAAIISRPNNYERWTDTLRRLQPLAAIIYDAEALYWRRVDRQSRLMADRDVQAERRREARRQAAVERSIAATADVIVAISPSEAAWFRREGSRNRVFVLPPVGDAAPRSCTPGLAARSGLLFVAGWLGGVDSPNRDGLQWFVREVLPLVQHAVPQVRVRVTGAAADNAQVVRRTDALDFQGIVDDLTALYDASRVCIAPVRYGAGVKLKVIEAIDQHIPLVTTSVGIEGIPDGAAAARVADRPERFAEAIVSLLTDDDEWRRQQAAAAAIAASWRRRRDHDWNRVISFARERIVAARVRRDPEPAGTARPPRQRR